MSASRQGAHDLRRGDSVLPAWVKEAGRAILRPIVGAALALRITANTVTVIGLVITTAAAIVIAEGWLVAGALILLGGSLLDAVDGALARATGGGTPFGSFLDSTLDRASEAILFLGVAGYYLTTSAAPAVPVMLAMLALAGSFLVSYARARAEGIGLSASVGLAPRTERLVLVIAGIGLAGLGLGQALIAALIIIAGLSAATVIQRIWHVWRVSAAAPPTNKEV
jgi:CDP-diacylglycerol---glycerol-3-phosphate 3-phosphatidyltransferase